ncbi:MAG: response regulator [Polyangiales bacterium]
MRTGLVFVVDDDDSVRDAVVALLRSAGHRTAAFASAPAFLAESVPSEPHCLVLDNGLPELSGLDLQDRLGRERRNTPIIFITGESTIPDSVRAMKAGAHEFLNKPFDDDALLAAVDSALVRQHAIALQRAQQDALRERHHTLTPREREVMALVVSGLLNKEIAASLGTSEITVKIQRGKVMRKMNAASLPELVRFASRLDEG